MSDPRPFVLRAPDAAELDRYAELVAESYVVDEAQARERGRARGVADHRVLVEDEAIRGGCFLHRMGMYLLGRHVPCLGVGGVLVPPAARSRGLAEGLMRAVLEEARAGGYPLSALFPATQPLYRRVGYEQAGLWTVYEVALADLGAPSSARGDLDEVSLEEARPILEALYRPLAQRTSGHLERSDAIWTNILHPPSGTARVYAVREGGAVTGATVVRAQRTSGFAFDLDVAELLASTPSAVARLARFLEGHRSLGQHVRMSAGPFEPLWLSCRDARPRVVDQWRFMLRVVDVPGALLARGFGPGVSGEVCFTVEDELFEENRGPWRLRVERGRAEIEGGGAPTCHLTIRALGALVGGGVSAEHLALAGLLEGASPQTLETWSHLFAGPVPLLRDFF